MPRLALLHVGLVVGVDEDGEGRARERDLGPAQRREDAGADRGARRIVDGEIGKPRGRRQHARAIEIRETFPDIWPTAFIWAFTIGMAIYVGGPLSGAHYNPAVTLAMAATRRHPWRLVPLYIGCQLVGWFVGAAGLVMIFRPAMEAKAAELTKA